MTDAMKMRTMRKMKKDLMDTMSSSDSLTGPQRVERQGMFVEIKTVKDQILAFYSFGVGAGARSLHYSARILFPPIEWGASRIGFRLLFDRDHTLAGSLRRLQAPINLSYAI